MICGLVANDFSGINSCFDMIENPAQLKSNIIYDFVPISNPSGKLLFMLHKLCRDPSTASSDLILRFSTCNLSCKPLTFRLQLCYGN